LMCDEEGFINIVIILAQLDQIATDNPFHLLINLNPCLINQLAWEAQLFRMMHAVFTSTTTSTSCRFE